MTVHNTPQHDDDERRGKDTSTDQPDQDGEPYPSHSQGSTAPGCPDRASPDQSGDELSVISLAQQDADAAREARQSVLRSEKLRALGQMASGVAHDLNQSLALIAGYGELLERELADPSPDPRRLREYAAIMRAAAADGGELAKRLLTFSRVQAQGPAVRVGAASLLRDVARLTAPRWRDASRAAGYPVSLSIMTNGDDEVLAVQGWPSSLRDALTNLVLNAVDALPSGGRIQLLARRDGNRVMILVADTGIGMPPEVRARIFEPFFTTKGERGTGLGLAQVFAIVQQHGGDVEVQSTPGRGTTFALRLPAASPACHDRYGGEHAPDAEHAPRRVLAVDDDPAHGRMLAAMLGHEGHQVTVVTSAAEALDRLAVADFDVVISDLALGAGPDGWHLAERVRRDRLDVRVCLVTGWGGDIDPAEAAERGVAAVLAKPYGLGELLTVVGAR